MSAAEYFYRYTKKQTEKKAKLLLKWVFHIKGQAYYCVSGTLLRPIKSVSVEFFRQRPIFFGWSGRNHLPGVSSTDWKQIVRFSNSFFFGCRSIFVLLWATSSSFTRYRYRYCV
jgi:hypothetical protein